jgi:hypothetical protein
MKQKFSPYFGKMILRVVASTPILSLEIRKLAAGECVFCRRRNAIFQRAPSKNSLSSRAAKLVFQVAAAATRERMEKPLEERQKTHSSGTQAIPRVRKSTQIFPRRLCIIRQTKLLLSFSCQIIIHCFLSTHIIRPSST